MARAPKVIEPAKGLYKNGSRFWLRTFRAPLTGRSKPVSTGTADVSVANAIVAMLDVLRAGDHGQKQWFDAVLDGDVTLAELYTRYAAGTLHTLREERAAVATRRADVDLEPLVEKWHRLVLLGSDMGDQQRGDYVRQVRCLIPANEPFPRSRLTEDYVRERLNGLTGRDGAPLAGGSKRAYFNAWVRWFKYARKQAEITIDPFADVEPPAWGEARAVFFEWDELQAVLGKIAEGDIKCALRLMFGGGLELNAVLSLTVGDIKGGEDRIVRAKGSKNEFRARDVFMDAWAWPEIAARAAGRPAHEPLLPDLTQDGDDVRAALYEAQVALGRVAAPAVSERSGKKLWGEVANLHTLHDARHTYAMIRILGLDGAEPESMKFVSHNLGHADEQMVMRIYSKCGGEQRARLIQKRRDRERGRRAAAAVAA